MKNNIKNIFNEIELSSEVRADIFNHCIEKQHVKNVRIRYAGQIAAAIVCALFLFGTGTVYAAVSIYQEYMEKMSDGEIEQRYEAVQSGSKEADSFSRRLSEEERQRMEGLRQAYKDGEKFPENSMMLIAGQEQIENPKSLYYDYVSCLFYLPEDTLSDEQLLQIIDVWEKANYSLEKINNETLQIETVTEEDAIQDLQNEMKKYQQEVATTDEEKVLYFIGRMLSEDLFGGEGNPISLDDYECQVTLYGETNKKIWAVIENEEVKYSIFFTEDSTPDCLSLYSYHRFYKKDIEKKVEIDKDYLCAISEEIPAYLERYMSVTDSIDKKEIYHEMYLVFTDRKGNRYRMLISADGTFGEILTYEAGKYADVYLSGEEI